MIFYFDLNKYNNGDFDYDLKSENHNFYFVQAKTIKIIYISIKSYTVIWQIM